MRTAIELRNAILYSDETSEDYWFQLKEEVKEYLASDAPIEEKKILNDITESLLMICSGFEYRKKMCDRQ